MGRYDGMGRLKVQYNKARMHVLLSGEGQKRMTTVSNLGIYGVQILAFYNGEEMLLVFSGHQCICETLEH